MKHISAARGAVGPLASHLSSFTVFFRPVLLLLLTAFCADVNVTTVHGQAVSPALVAPAPLTYVPGMSIGTDNGSNYYLQVNLQWTNNCAAPYILIETCTNGVNWFHTSGDVHVVPGPNATTAIKNVPQSLYYRFRVSAFDGINLSPPSNVLPIWGEEQPTFVTAIVLNPNQVAISWKKNSASESGFLIEQATNNAFVGTIVRTGANSTTVPGATLYATNTGFASGVTYYWRVSATNALGYSSEPSLVVSAAPNAVPPPSSYFQAYNSAAGVGLQWNSGGGLVDRWYVDVSVGDTNSWQNLYSIAGGYASYGTGYSWTDRGESPGSTCYYRVTASNLVGTASSAIQSVIIPASIGASVWYVDASATGNGTGTNWANAYPNFASIAWPNIQPGALIWVAPGTYNEVLYVGASGASNAPIVIKAATTNSPRPGMVQVIAGVNYNPYVWLDGAKSDSFTFTSTDQITNNCNWLFFGATNVARGYFTVATGMHIKWCQFTGPFNDPINFGEGTVDGVHIQEGMAGDTEVGYCWCHDLAGDGVNWAGYSGTEAWGAVNIHHCLVEHVSGNFMMGSSGVDVHDCILRDWVGPTPRGVHPDGIQVWPDYVRVYNNIIRDTPGEAIYPELSATNGVGFLIYNNIVYGTGAITNVAGGYQPNGGTTWSTEPGYLIPTMTFSNALIANNTFYGFDNSYISVNRRVGECTILQLRGWTVANNLFFTHSPGEQVSLSTNDYTTADVVFDWNDVCGTNTMFNYGQGDYPYPAAFASATGFTNNFTWVPQFVSAASSAGQQYPYDFHLSGSASQRLAGTNLSSWLPIAPGIDRNQDGTTRAATGWPVGALQASAGTNLVLWYSFNSDFSTNVGKVTDDSGRGADGWMFSATNWPSLTNRPSGGGAASFVHYADGSQFGGGQYIAVTNVTSLDNLSSATISAWCWYYPSVENNFANDQTATIMNATWPGAVGSWHFGRYFSSSTEFVAFTNAAAQNPTVLLSFPDVAPTGDSGGWHHYAVTFDGTQFIGYFNGAPVATNSSMGIDALRIGGQFRWLGVSCWPHSGTPQWGDDPYPNAGWMNGAMDELRVYNRALSPTEIQAVYSGASLPATTNGSRPSPPLGLRIIAGGP